VGADWSARLAQEFSAGARDGGDDLRAAAAARDALEALKPALEAPWDDEDVALVRGTAFDGWFGLEHLRAAADAGEVLEAGPQRRGNMWDALTVIP